jgi:thiamine kinase-like enzyme
MLEVGVILNLIGIGNTAEVFDYEEGKVLKLFYKKYSQESVRKEYENSKLIMDLDLPSPDVYGLITIDNRLGIIFEKLLGESMLDKIFNGANVELLVSQMIELHQKFMVKTNKKIESYKDFLIRTVNGDENLVAMINKLPDGDYLLHGDFHPGNVWINLDNSMYVIDFMNICKGPKEYDVTRTYFLICEARIPSTTPNYDEIKKMSKLLADAYLQGMNYSFKDIEPYYEIIKLSREAEMQ